MDIKILRFLSFFLVFLYSFSSYAAYPGLMCDYSKITGVVSSIQFDVFHGYSYIEILTPEDGFFGGYIYSYYPSLAEKAMRIATLSFESNRDVSVCIYNETVIYGIQMESEK